MLKEVGAQAGHVALALVELDEVGGDERDAGVGRGAGEGVVGGALGEVGPGQAAEQGAVLLDDRVGFDPLRERRLGVDERTGVVGWRNDRRTSRLKKAVGWATIEALQVAVDGG